MKIAARVFMIIYRVTAIAVVSAALAIIILFLFGIRPYAVRTGSMEPTIPQGAMCFVNSRSPFGDVEKDDIIAFKAGEMFVTHRVAEVGNGKITTKGDANNTVDSTRVTQDNYIGKTLFWIPEIGKVPLYAQTPAGRYVLIAAFLLFLLLGIIYDRTAKWYKRNKEAEEDTPSDSYVIMS